MNIQKYLDKARKSISRFCAEECKAYCCRKGYLVLTLEQTKIIIKDKIYDFEQRGLLKKNGKNYSLFIGNYDYPCPCLQEHKCIIHRSPQRPLACKDFPIFITENTIRFSPRCLAVKLNMFYPHIKKLMKMSYNIDESNTIFDSEFYNIPIEKIE